jgi:hypothetical protein
MSEENTLVLAALLSLEPTPGFEPGTFSLPSGLRTLANSIDLTHDDEFRARPFTSPSIGTVSTRWRRTPMDCKHDDLSERRTVHVKCKAARTIGTQPPEPCSPKWRRRGCLQFLAALGRLDCRNYHHAMLSFLNHKTRKSRRVKILSG